MFADPQFIQKPSLSYAAVQAAIEASISTLNHNDLFGIQGGAPGDYSHLTALQASGLTGGLNTTLHLHDTYLTAAEGDAAYLAIGANAVSATVLQTPRLIGGVSFNGSADIVPTTIVVADTADTTAFVGLWDSATGNLLPKTDAGLLYDATAGQLQLPTSGSGAGILLGGDTQLYRSSANLLRTPDSFYVDAALTVVTTAYVGGIITADADQGSSGSLYFPATTYSIPATGSHYQIRGYGNVIVDTNGAHTSYYNSATFEFGTRIATGTNNSGYFRGIGISNLRNSVGTSLGNDDGTLAELAGFHNQVGHYVTDTGYLGNTTLVRGHNTTLYKHYGTIGTAIGYDVTVSGAVNPTLLAGFRSQVPAALGAWGYYGVGTANNALVGDTVIGAVTVPTAKLQVVGAVTLSGNLTAGDAITDAHTITGKTTITDTGEIALDLIGNYNSGILRLTDVTTDATQKLSKIVSRHYTNAEEDVQMMLTVNNLTANLLYLGGGNSASNTATSILFVTGATNTTLTGTTRATIDAAGLFNVVGNQTIGGTLGVANLATINTGKAGTGLKVYAGAGATDGIMLIGRTTDNDQNIEFRNTGDTARLGRIHVGNGGLDLGGNAAGTPNLTINTAGNVTLSNDLEITGGDLTSAAATFNLLASPTTIVMGAAATALTLGAATGTLTVNNATLAAKAGTFQTADGQTSLTAKSSGTGDRWEIIPLAAGTGIQENALNQGRTDYEPLLITGESVTLRYRTGVFTNADGLTLNSSGNVVIANDLNVNGGDIDTSAVTLNLGATASTLNLKNEVSITATDTSPVVSDSNALGTTSKMWSDLFLADGGVINFNAGNATLTHSAGLLTSNVAISVLDEVYGVGWNASTQVPTKNAVYDKIEAVIAGIPVAGATVALDNLAVVAINTALLPGVDDTIALGSTTKQWSDAFIGSGGVINFNAGDVTITHSTDTLTIGGAIALNLSGANSTSNTALKVENTSNAAAASHAYLEAAVGGTTSIGDPHIRFTIPGGTSWYAGVDNSVSDLFYIGTGAVVGTTPWFAVGNNTMTLGRDTATGLAITTYASGFDMTHSDNNSTNHITIKNAGTGATTNAKVRIYTEGGQGDPFIQLSINTGTDWHIGSDNSDADKFKIGTGSVVGTATLLTIDNAGVITVAAPIALKSYTVATLPAGVAGYKAYVTDALAPTYLTTVVGGGAIVTEVFYNGTNYVCT